MLRRISSKTSRVIGVLLGCKLVSNMLFSSKNGNFAKYAHRVRSLKGMSVNDKLAELEALCKSTCISFA